MFTLRQKVDFDAGHRFLFPKDKDETKEGEIEFYTLCTYAYAYLKEIDYDVAKRMDIKEIIEYSSPFVNPLPSALLNWNHKIELRHSSRMSLIQFITAKENVRVMHKLNMTIYESLPAIIGAYSQDGFAPEFEQNMEFGSEYMQSILDIPLNDALAILEWYYKHNNWLSDNFGVFQPGLSKGIDMESHFNAYGWISFLSMIAKEGVFTIAGGDKNAIDCAKYSKLYDVLYYASEKKSSEDLINFHQEQKS